MRLADPGRSRAVLIGTPSYLDSGLPDVPVVANNTADFAAVLADPDLGGLDPGRCVSAPADATLTRIGELLTEAADDAEDLLLVYYAGHGLLDRRGQLFLALTGTHPDRPAFTALPYETLRTVCLDSPASSKVVILDSCFSGRAIGEALADGEQQILGQLDISGTCTITSAPANRTALILPGERHTAFTGRLLELLSQGVPNAGPVLSMGDIYRHLHARLKADGLPIPQLRGTGLANLLGLVRNRRPVPPVPALLPEEIRGGLASHDPEVRRGAVEALEAWLTTTGTGLATAAGTGAATATITVSADGPAPDAAAITVITAFRRPAAEPVAEPSAQPAAVRSQDPDTRAARTSGFLKAMMTARRIGIDHWRAAALARIAAVAAPVDRVTCARILTESTLATQHIDEEYSLGFARAAAARALALLDRDEALRTADGITDDFQRARAFAGIAESLAAADPEKASRLIGRARETAAAVPPDRRDEVLVEVVRALAALDATEAELLAGSLVDGPLRSTALAGIVRVIASHDVAGARAVARRIPDGLQRVFALADVMQAEAQSHWPTATAEHARTVAGRIFDTVTRFTALAEVARAVAPADLAMALEIVDAIPEGRWRAEATAAVAPTLAAVDRDELARRMGRDLVSVSALGDRSEKAWGLAAVARAIAVLYYDEAMRVVDTITEESARAHALEEIALAIAGGER